MLDFNGGLIGKYKESIGSQSNPGVWTLNEQRIWRGVAGRWPTAPLPGDPFPTAYRELIDAATTKYFVDSLTGSDLSTGTSTETAFATVDHAVATAPTGSTIVVYPGTYNNPNSYASMYDSYYSSVLIDRAKHLTFICAPGRVVFTGTDLGRRDFGAATFGNASSKLYGAIIKRNNGGRTNNYSTAMNRSGGGQFYNCVFQEIGSNGYFSLHYASAAITWSNCLIIGGSWRGNYNSTGSLLYSASNNASTSAIGTNTGNGLGVAINSDWSVGSTAYGVYSGTYAWLDAVVTYPS